MIAFPVKFCPLPNRLNRQKQLILLMSEKLVIYIQVSLEGFKTL